MSHPRHSTTAGLHANQVRKGTTVPYTAHLLGVAALVIDHGGDEDQAMAALLHDAIEDQGRGGRTRAEIEAKFGARVARIVEGCTDADTIPKPPWRERKEAYLAHLGHAPIEVRRVAAADKLHNARAILVDYRHIGKAFVGAVQRRARRAAVVLPESRHGVAKRGRDWGEREPCRPAR